MEYTVNKLAKLAGVSTRTLRYYDKMDLLKPLRINSSGYRIYGQNEIDRLRQILFYRELGVKLEEIREIVTRPDFDQAKALESHLTALLQKRDQLELLICNARKAVAASKGETIMSDQEKFEGFKDQMIEDNEAKYGAEIRGKYGDDAVNASNAKVKAMTDQQMEAAESLRCAINDTLKAAFPSGDPASPLAQRVCGLHKEWLMLYYSGYTREYHRGLAQMYVDDPRFGQYYDQIAPGCTVFLKDAIEIYCG